MFTGVDDLRYTLGGTLELSRTCIALVLHRGHMRTLNKYALLLPVRVCSVILPKERTELEQPPRNNLLYNANSKQGVQRLLALCRRPRVFLPPHTATLSAGRVTKLALLPDWTAQGATRRGHEGQRSSGTFDGGDGSCESPGARVLREVT